MNTEYAENAQRVTEKRKTSTIDQLSMHKIISV